MVWPQLLGHHALSPETHHVQRQACALAKFDDLLCGVVHRLMRLACQQDALRAMGHRVVDEGSDEGRFSRAWRPLQQAQWPLGP